MYNLFGWLILLAFSLVPNEGLCGSLPVYSSNGFTCNAAGIIVTCKGAFPNHEAPVLTGVGSNAVGIIAQYPDHVWSYQSDTGCLCRGTAQTLECASRQGKKKNFQGPGAVQLSSAWCKHGY